MSNSVANGTHPVPSRRRFLRDACCGFGGLALSSLLAGQTVRAAARNGPAGRLPHFQPRADAVIFLFMAGGPSHLETFDPKPLLNHHNLGFTMWMAGGGIRGGQVLGATDALGLRAVEQPQHFRDLHATILHLLGLDQHRLTFPHLGRDERLTFLEGKVMRNALK